MGLTEVVLHLPRIWRKYRKLIKAIRDRRPAWPCSSTFPRSTFGLPKSFTGWGFRSLLSSARSYGPEEAPHQARRKFIDRMLVIFPFEEPFYRENGVEAEFVGHPLADLPLPAFTAGNLPGNMAWTGHDWIAMLPVAVQGDSRHLRRC